MLRTFLTDFLVPYIIITLVISFLSSGFITFSMIVATPMAIAYLLALNVSNKIYFSILTVTVLIYSLLYFNSWLLADMLGNGLGGIAIASTIIAMLFVFVLLLIVVRPFRTIRMRSRLKSLNLN